MFMCIIQAPNLPIMVQLWRRPIRYKLGPANVLKKLGLLRPSCRMRLYYNIINKIESKQFSIVIYSEIGETGGNCNIFHIFAHYVEHVFY